MRPTFYFFLFIFFFKAIVCNAQNVVIRGDVSDGVTSVNGKPIESLLISGKDFFNGNIEAALDNLPAYIVKNLKVYNKAGELSELTGRDMHDELCVHCPVSYRELYQCRTPIPDGLIDFQPQLVEETGVDFSITNNNQHQRIS